jgi:hypothetical protein
MTGEKPQLTHKVKTVRKVKTGKSQTAALKRKRKVPALA